MKIDQLCPSISVTVPTSKTYALALMYISRKIIVAAPFIKQSSTPAIIPTVFPPLINRLEEPTFLDPIVLISKLANNLPAINEVGIDPIK